jgi:flagellar biosynthesis/type III secretory pathway protein FliH
LTNQLFTWPSVRPDPRPPAVPSFEELERQTREAARAEGLAEGRRQAEGELAQKIKALQMLQKSLEHHRVQMAEQQVSEIVEFLRGAFVALLGRALRIEPELFSTLLRQAIDAMPASGTLSIRAHPELAHVLAGLMDQTVSEDTSLPPLTIQVDSERASWSADLVAEFNCLLEQGVSFER